MRASFEDYHKDNPTLWTGFERVALETIAKGFKHYSSKGIFEILRWQTGVTGNDQFKVNNNYAPDYSRLFMTRHPEHEGFFFLRGSKGRVRDLSGFNEPQAIQRVQASNDNERELQAYQSAEESVRAFTREVDKLGQTGLFD